MENYQQSLDFLYGLRVHGTKLGLNNILRLLYLLGNPHQSLNFYHIGGTNGKGSVAAMLQALLRTTHRRVGMFTSPHLEDFRERIRTNDRFITPAEVVSGLSRIRPLLSRVARSPGCSHPTYFEVVTALACRYFSRRRVQAVVWEVGMGGRLDATNVVKPGVTVITNVSLDHRQYLGHSLGEVVREKGGIIKKNTPVITAETGPKVLSQLKQICRRKGAPLLEVMANYGSRVEEWTEKGQIITIRGPERTYRNLVLPLPGDHQVINCLTAFAAWEQGDKLAFQTSRDRVRAALKNVSWPGRFEIRGGPLRLILDGAHNQAGARALARTLKKTTRDQLVVLILGVLADKDIEGVCRPLVPLARKVITVQPESQRALPASELARICRAVARPRKVPVLARKKLESALNYCYHSLAESDWVCITGSLYLVGEARALLRKRGNLNTGSQKESLMPAEKTTAIVNATILRPALEPRPGSLLFRDGKIKKILPEKYPSLPSDISIIDAKGNLVSPGFIDLHVHGGGGNHFSDNSDRELLAILKTHARFGTTSLLPTLTASSQKDVLGVIRTINKAITGRKGRGGILGLNLEGPYLSIGKRGAQPLRFLRPPRVGDVEKILETANGLVRIMTLAPELDGAFGMIRLLKRSGVIPAIGHTTAGYETTRRAISAGLAYATHVFNSYPPLHHRRPGALGAVLESERLYIEILSDGIHLSPVIIRLLFRLKKLERILLVTDGNAALGKKIRHFFMGGREVRVDSRGARLEDGTLVGSVVPMNQAISNLVRFTGLSLPRVLAVATLNPARVLGLDDRKGDLRKGMDADIMILDKKLNIKRTIVAGKTVYRRKAKS